MDRQSGGSRRQTDRQGTPGPSRALSFRRRKLLSQLLQLLSHSLAERLFFFACACGDLRGACLTAWRLWGWPLGPSLMCLGKAPACSPKPPLTSPVWTPSPGPALAAFSVSTPSCPSRAAMCVCSYQSPGCVIIELSLHRKSQIPFDSVYPFSPCFLFVFVLSVLCESE